MAVERFAFIAVLRRKKKIHGLVHMTIAYCIAAELYICAAPILMVLDSLNPVKV